MARKYLAFDIETAKVIPGPRFDWRAHRPLGITCIASLSEDDDEPRVWLSRTPTGTPAPQMTRSDTAAFVEYLDRAAQEGFTPLSWNGLAFDLDVLAEESGLADTCQRLARSHVDMMFQVLCEKGFAWRSRAPQRGSACRASWQGWKGSTRPPCGLPGKRTW